MESKNITLSSEMRERVPAFVGGALYASFTNTPSDEALLSEMRAEEKRAASLYSVDTIKLIPGIAATRAAYKACGKDPSRYRPSDEQLLRRVIQGKELWSISTAVDIGNLASLRSGYSIGCFDYDLISGPDITLGIGRHGEPYEGIGRGVINIEGMPVYRDAVGGIGTPTSDNERTKMTLATTHMLALVNGYDGDKDAVTACLNFMKDAFERYLGAECRTEYF